jgi:lysophospholipase L1-like esterase
MKTRFLIVKLIVISSIIIIFPISPIRSAKKEKTWDYVFIGGARGTWGWTEYYGDYIETDLDVTIVRHDYHYPKLLASMLLENLQNNEELRYDIINAEVITIGVGFYDMNFATLYAPHLINEKLKTFRETYDAMLSEILSLNNSSDTIIRVMDFFCPYLRRYTDRGIYEDTKRYWMEFNKCIADVAEKHGIPVAQVFQAMNGIHGDDDPNEKGYLAPDGVTLSDEGNKVVANLFRELGYE